MKIKAGILTLFLMILATLGGYVWFKNSFSSQQEIAQYKYSPGTEFTIINSKGTKINLQIRDVELDPEDPEQEIYLYQVFYKVEGNEEWRSLCQPAYNDKVGRAVILSSLWDKKTKDFLGSNNSLPFYCTSGNVGKCLRMGYKPWKEVNGQSLQDYYQACIRMMKADYCGDGTPHTRNGIRVEVYDVLGIQNRIDVPELTFEAAWNKDGAVCLNKTRLGHKLTDVCQECPDKLAGRINEDGSCSTAKEALSNFEDILIFNESGEN